MKALPIFLLLIGCSQRLADAVPEPEGHVVAECRGTGKDYWYYEGGQRRAILSRDDYAEECVP